MKKIRLSEFKQKEVINCRDGERLGYVCDFDFNLETGCICNIIIPGPCKVWGIMGRENEYIINFCCIKQIGEDVILVDIDAKKCLVKLDY